MAAGLAPHWWTMALRGLAAALFGVACFVWPDMRLSMLVLLYGGYLFVDGVFALIAGRLVDSWPLLLEAFVVIGLGIIVQLWPGIEGLALVSWISFWALATGIFKISTAVRLRASIPGEWLLALCGIFSVLFGIVVVIWHPETRPALVWTVGLYALFLGMLLLALAFRLLHWDRTVSMQKWLES